MNKITRILNDMIRGGLFFLIPMFVIIFLINKIWDKIMSLSKSLAGLFGIQQTMEGGLGAIITISVILLICLISGMLMRVVLIKNLRNKLDAFLEKKIPGYGVYKLTMEKKFSKEDAPSRPVVLLTIDGISQPGVVVEEINDGRMIIYVPTQSALAGGRVYLVNSDAITKLDITESKLQTILSAQGKGLGKLAGINLLS
jgi:uncharacterized membrane protein